MINKSQEIIVNESKYPACVIAGPGTGKTFTIVRKIISLIKNDGLAPNRILVTSFTKKAANELIERVESELKKENIKADTSNMLIGNFHSLALNFLRKYKSFSGDILEKRVIDQAMEGYLLEKNLHIFKNIDDFDTYISYNEVGQIMGIFSYITNNLIDLNALRESNDKKDRLGLEIYLKWASFLDENKLINYQLILKNFYNLLDDFEYGRKIRDEIDFVIIDEYQDTNHIQEEIGFKLLKGKNIMVFGDDDQSLYAFRGASPENLTDFNKTCERKLKCKANFYSLNINYRSNQEIIDKSKDFLSQSGAFDQIKDLKAFDEENNHNTVVRARALNYDNILKIIKELNKDINLNQIAFLFPSLKHKYPKDLQSFFEFNKIGVLNKSSKLFFRRDEVRILLFILLSIYSRKPKSKEGSNENNYKRAQETRFKTYLISIFDDVNFKKDKDLNCFISNKKEKIKENLSYTDIIYESFKLPIVKSYLDQELKGLKAIRNLSNIGKFTEIITDFIDINGPDINFYQKSVELFYGYIFYLFKNELVPEFEDFDTPKNAINFLTIHQSKGLEYDVVFVSGLYENPSSPKMGFSKNIRDKNGNNEYKNFFRKYYTAMTRAKKLLVILDNSENFQIKNFQKGLNNSSNLSTLDLKFEKEEVKKEILAYTTDIEVYKSCPLKYKFIRLLSFRKEKSKSLIFGSNVHAIAEFLTNLQKEGKSLDLVNEFIKNNKIYQKPIENFVNRDFNIKESELNLKLDRGFYLLQGNIDVVLEDGSIVDIKTGKVNENYLERYKNQLLTYYNLFVYNNKKIKDLYLYFIESDKLIKVKRDNFNISMIDNLAKNIVKRNIEVKTSNRDECKFCPMAYFCDRA
ncbi:ATP-dependent helicase [Anaerococcus sp. AGMB00486]|uniref:DNA 3'-5' helicase n=2 Tax=Anaerococcus TaxID=165779 RepID=A0ABX2NBQ7_9FIRM|nr:MULTISPECIES: ATP-dependent DNA helicase [Anaerococcus]MDY3006641.1 ATP-dependent DNA helicase [Anaerococcus porci]MSS78108.1 ATP-dependent helicase [Anaerococcus porci]NVF12088.1 ATP-dependent helicase [Anaerococcus faecalis]